uniref:zinc finger protein ZAT3-like n=1 Tax=Erigeron canadensis TaxID=72917 RepID=UPI001CB8D2B4|nr:zinc finger protein ZAT3-like [Erigeron canadensis]
MEELDYKMIGSPALSDQGKMVIKLKFPKLERDIENESKNEDQDGEAGLMMMKKMPNVRVCQECKKEFSSGKALGGHMRVHAIHQSSNSTTTTNFNNKQNPNSSNSSSSKKVKKDFKVAVNNKKKPLAAAVKKPYYLDSVNNEGKPMCSQCGKTFPSMKSLFGHMRCHPERVWRGILPPPNINGLIKPAANNNNNKKLVDLTQFLRGWGVTEKRGRPSLKQFNSDDDESDEDEDGVLLEAVEDLMSLAKGNNDNSVTTKFEGSDSSTFVNRKGVNLELENDDDE